MVRDGKARRLALAASVVALVSSGCASGLGGDTYSRDEVRRTMTVQYGTVEAVRPVRIEGTKSPVGTVAGAAIGGIAGSGVGEGRGQAAATVLGAVVGGLAGSAVEEGVTRKPGFEFTVRLDNGQVLAVVQEAAGEDIRPGDRVRVLREGGRTRVTR